MRGKRSVRVLLQQRVGITPADAGKTDRSPRNPVEPPDHPRGCGENDPIFALTVADEGSPPRMRGKRNPTYEDFGEDRITPADAGKTL